MLTFRPLKPGLAAVLLVLCCFLLLCWGSAPAWATPIDWNPTVDGDQSALTLSASPGDTIRVTDNGDPGGSTLTIDVDDLTITSAGAAYADIMIVVDNTVTTLTLDNLHLSAPDDHYALDFAANATLYLSGDCALTGGYTTNDSIEPHAINSVADLTVEVGAAALTLTGGEHSHWNGVGGSAIQTAGDLNVNVGPGGSLIAMGGASDRVGGSGLAVGYYDTLTLTNDGAAEVRGGQGSSNLSRALYGGSVTLTGTSRIALEGGTYGIQLSNTLTVDASVELRAAEIGISFSGSTSYTLLGNGNLTVYAASNGISVSGDLKLDFAGNLRIESGREGISVNNGNLELACTGDLLIESGGDGISVAFGSLELAVTGNLRIESGGWGIYVYNNLTVSSAPRSLTIRPGTNKVAIYIDSGTPGTQISNSFGIPLINRDTNPVIWPGYRVTYSAPEHTGGSVPTDGTVYAYRDSVTVLANTGNLTRAGYSLAGWQTSGGQVYQAGASVTMLDNLRLEAVWTADSPNGSGGSGGGDSERTHYTYHTLRFEPNGGTRIASQNVREGARATQPTNPTRTGYRFTGWYTDAACTQPYDFTSTVREAFTLYAGWQALEPATPVTHAAYITGYPDGTFRPENPLTRAEAATLIYRLLGQPATSGAAGFADVTAGDWYHAAVTALTARGLLTGYADGSLRPNETITRAEFVTLALRYAGLSERAGGVGFADIAEDHWAAGAVAAAVEAGWLTGHADGSFRPESPVTRAEAVTILNRVSGCGGVTAGAGFADVASDYWAYADILAASTAHTH